MPRSSYAAEQRLEERTSLSRGSIGKGSLTGRYSIGGSAAGGGGYNDAISIGSAATRHWVNSVSDIYGPDEIEELLDDLNRLEMAGGASFTDEDEPVVIDMGYHNNSHHPEPELVQMQLVGVGESSGRGGPPRARLKHDNDVGGGGGAMSDPLTGDLLIEGVGDCDNQGAAEVPSTAMAHTMSAGGSPTFSVRSWDSHTHYQEFKEPEDDDPDSFFPSRPMQSIVCYCDMSVFKSPPTLLRVLLVVSSSYYSDKCQFFDSKGQALYMNVGNGHFVIKVYGFFEAKQPKVPNCMLKLCINWKVHSRNRKC